MIVSESQKVNFMFYSAEYHKCKACLRSMFPGSGSVLLTLSNAYGEQTLAEVEDVQPGSLGQTVLFVLFLITIFLFASTYQSGQNKRKVNIYFW